MSFTKPIHFLEVQTRSGLLQEENLYCMHAKGRAEDKHFYFYFSKIQQQVSHSITIYNRIEFLIRL